MTLKVTTADGVNILDLLKNPPQALFYIKDYFPRQITFYSIIAEPSGNYCVAVGETRIDLSDLTKVKTLSLSKVYVSLSGVWTGIAKEYKDEYEERLRQRSGSMCNAVYNLMYDADMALERAHQEKERESRLPEKYRREV